MSSSDTIPLRSLLEFAESGTCRCVLLPNMQVVTDEDIFVHRELPCFKRYKININIFIEIGFLSLMRLRAPPRLDTDNDNYNGSGNGNDNDKANNKQENCRNNVNITSV